MNRRGVLRTICRSALVLALLRGLALDPISAIQLEAIAAPQSLQSPTPKAEPKNQRKHRKKRAKDRTKSATEIKKPARCVTKKGKPCRAPSPTPMASPTPTPLPMPTELSEEETCKLQVVGDHLFNCCGDWGIQPDQDLWYSVFRNCTDYAYDLHRWCEKEGYSCLSVAAKCSKPSGESEEWGHALVLVKLVDSWALVDPTSGVVVGTVPGSQMPSDYPDIPDELICKAMGKSPSECGCKENGTCLCMAFRMSKDPELPNTDPGLCVRLLMETRDGVAQNLTKCTSCCDWKAKHNEKYGPDLCWSIRPADSGGLPSLDPLKYLSWLGQCTKWYEDIAKSRALCQHACRAEFSGDQPCRPLCAGKHCGDDGCSGSCGACEADEMCAMGRCVSSKKTDPKTAIPDEERTPTPPPEAALEARDVVVP